MKKILLIVLAVLMVASFSACGPKEPADNGGDKAETRTIIDALGREVVVPAKVERIVALSNVPRMVVYLGLVDKVVGYSGMDPERVNPLTAYAYVSRDQWKNIPLVGTDSAGMTDYYPEEIIAVRPDVIFCSYPLDTAEKMQAQTGVPVIIVEMGNLFEEDYNQSLRIIAETCGVEQRAEEVISYIDAMLADLDGRTGDIPEGDKPSALSAAATFKGAHGIEGVRVKDQVLDAVNAVNIAYQNITGSNDTAVEVDKEQILAWNAEYIFCDFGGVELVKQDVAANPNFYAQLDAYKNGRIYQYPSSTSYYSNLEIPLANAYFVGSILYPEKFADVDLEAKADEIFKFFLGVDGYMSVLNEFGASYGPIDFSKK